MMVSVINCLLVLNMVRVEFRKQSFQIHTPQGPARCNTCGCKMLTHSGPKPIYSWCYNCFRHWEEKGRPEFKRKQNTTNKTYSTNNDIDDFIDDE